MASDEPLSLADRLTQAIDLLGGIRQSLYEDYPELCASIVLLAGTEIKWAIHRLESAHRTLSQANKTREPGYDL